MKTVLVYLVLVFAAIFVLPYHLYLKKLAKTNQQEAWEKYYKLINGFFKLELKIIGCKTTIKGKENIPKDKACLFVGNHRGIFDILISHDAIGSPLGFVAKKEMSKVPIVSQYMKDISCLFLDRDDIKQGLQTINQGAELLRQGHSIVLFPEGHRSQTDDLLPFKEGGYKMADKSGCPIIPFAISGTEKLREANPGKKIKKAKVIIEFGEPIYPNDFSIKERKEKYKEIPEIIQGMRTKHRV